MSEGRVVDTRVGRLVITTVGSGPPAVLWHSLFVDERSWARVSTELAGLRRLILVTGPGHGASLDPGHRYTLAECAAAADEVLTALGVDERVDWVGNAWGGHVGLRFAAGFPARTRSLVTIGTPIRRLSAGERVNTRVLLHVHRLLGPSRLVLDPVVEVLLAPGTRTGDREAVAYVRGCVTGADRRRLRNAVKSISLQREDLAAVLGRVRVPTLMVTGDEHAGWTPVELADAVTAVPDARSAVVTGAAYLPPLEQPEQVLRLVSEFWTTSLADASRGIR